MPGEWGPVIPKNENVSIPAVSTYRAPDFAMREGVSTIIDFDLHWAVYEWGRGNHLWGRERLFSGHNYHLLVPNSLFDEHPEYFALIEGKRNTAQLCTTNPDVRRIALARMRQGLKENPIDPEELGKSVGAVTVIPNDGFQFCECDNCMKLIPEDKGSADRIVDFVNYIARNFRDEYPDKQVIFLADYHSSGPPVFIRPEPNLCVWITKWRQDQFHGISPETPMGESLKNWGVFGIPMKVYTYCGSYGSFTFWPQVHTIRKDIPYYKTHRVVGVYSETPPNWGCQHLNFIVFPRLAWEVTPDVDAFVDEFCRLFYGPATRPMRAYYDLLETVAENGPPQFHDHKAIANLFATHLDQLGDYIEAAKRAAERAPAIYQKRVEFVAAGYTLARLYISTHRSERQFQQTTEPMTRKKLRQQMVNQYRELLQLIQSPQCANRLTRNSQFEPVIEKHLEYLEQGTTFGIGEFTYWEYCASGGRTGLNAEVKRGWVDGQWGLNLLPDTTGVLVYRFSAVEGGIFAKAKIVRLIFDCADLDKQSPDYNSSENRRANQNELAVSTDGGATYEILFRNQKQEKTSYDITPVITGKAQFLVRLSTHNAGNHEILSLVRIVVEGEVRAAGD